MNDQSTMLSNSYTLLWILMLNSTHATGTQNDMVRFRNLSQFLSRFCFCGEHQWTMDPWAFSHPVIGFL